VQDIHATLYLERSITEVENKSMGKNWYMIAKMNVEDCDALRRVTEAGSHGS
jgi:hypothetical protein